MKVTNSKNGYYTQDAEYVVNATASRITRGDGSYTELKPGQDAHKIARELASSEREDSEFEWSP